MTLEKWENYYLNLHTFYHEYMKGQHEILDTSHTNVVIITDEGLLAIQNELKMIKGIIRCLKIAHNQSQ